MPQPRPGSAPSSSYSGSRRDGRLRGANAEQMANRDNQVGAVERVEMEFMDAIGMQPPALLSGERGRDETARLRVIVESLEMRPHPGRDRGSTSHSHTFQLRKIRDRKNPRHNRHPDPGGAGAVAEAQEHVNIEKELGNRAA